MRRLVVVCSVCCHVVPAAALWTANPVWLVCCTRRDVLGPVLLAHTTSIPSVWIVQLTVFHVLACRPTVRHVSTGICIMASVWWPVRQEHILNWCYCRVSHAIRNVPGVRTAHTASSVSLDSSIWPTTVWICVHLATMLSIAIGHVCSAIQNALPATWPTQIVWVVLQT